MASSARLERRRPAAWTVVGAVAGGIFLTSCVDADFNLSYNISRRAFFIG